MKRPISLTLIAFAGLFQGMWGVLRALDWFQSARDVSAQGGILVLPLVSAFVFAGGVLIVIIALLYFLFAWGALTGRGWVWGVGLAATVLNLLIVLRFVLQEEEPLVPALLSALIPIVLLCYLIAPVGRRAFNTLPIAERM